MPDSVDTINVVSGTREIKGFKATVLDAQSATESSVESRYGASPDRISIHTTHTTKGSLLVQLDDGSEDEVKVTDSELTVRPGSRIAYVRSVTFDKKKMESESQIEAIANLDTGRYEVLGNHFSAWQKVTTWFFYGAGFLIFWTILAAILEGVVSTFLSDLLPDVSLEAFEILLIFCGSAAIVYHALLGRILMRNCAAVNETTEKSTVMIQNFIASS